VGAEVALAMTDEDRAYRDMDSVLTLKGPVGSARSPQIGGKHTTTTDLLGEEQPVPVKVTTEWRFSAGGG